MQSVFRVWSLAESPRQADRPVYFGTGNLLETSPFRPSTKGILIRKRELSMPETGAIYRYFGALSVPCKLLKTRDLHLSPKESDRKSTRLNSKSRPHLVCRLLLEKKKKQKKENRRKRKTPNRKEIQE